MKSVTASDLTTLYAPPRTSHKGQNGKLLIIGGSQFFHAASLWALEVASRIVDLVHYSSVPENNDLVMRIKAEFRDGIVVPRDAVERYVEEDDAILIGPGMVRAEGAEAGGIRKIRDIREIGEIKNEGEQTAALTNYLLWKYPKKQWVIDAGALQMMDVSLIPKNAILTPHQKEFHNLMRRAEVANKNFDVSSVPSRNNVEPSIINSSLGSEDPQNFVRSPHVFANKYHCIVLLKGQRDVICSPTECRVVEGGNAGMTKGGTGDVLAGLVAALACKNDPLLAAIAGSYINKKAGDELYQTVGPFFNASDLARQIPKTMKAIHLG